MIFIPGQILHAPYLVSDNEDVTGGPIIAQCLPALALGVKPVSADHYPLSAITGKTAYRTCGNARICLPNSAMPTPQTISFIVEQNQPAPGQVGLFGSIRNRVPQPFYCCVVDGKLRLYVAMAGISVQMFAVPWPAGIVKAAIDLISGHVMVNNVGTTFAPPGPLQGPDSPYFGIGAIADRAYGWGDYLGGPHDWTYHAFSVNTARLLGDAPGPVQWYTADGQHVYGFMLSTVPDQNAKPCRIHDLTITSSLTAGPLITVGGIYSPSFERLTLRGGGQSIASLGGSWSYPVRMTDCSLGAPYFGHGQSLWAQRNDFQYCGGEFRNCFVSMRDTFVAGSPRGGVMFNLRDGSQSFFDVGQADYEGLPPSQYFAYDATCPRPVVTNWIKGKNSPILVN